MKAVVFLFDVAQGVYDQSTVSGAQSSLVRRRRRRYRWMMMIRCCGVVVVVVVVVVATVVGVSAELRAHVRRLGGSILDDVSGTRLEPERVLNRLFFVSTPEKRRTHKYQARDMSTELQESKYIAIAMLSTFETFLFLVTY